MYYDYTVEIPKVRGKIVLMLTSHAFPTQHKNVTVTKP